MDSPWIRTPAQLEALACSLAGAGSLTIDTEADSLHHYPGKLCLVQIAEGAGRAPRVRLLDELRAKGRDAWVEEECAALAALSVPDRIADPDAYLKLKGAKELDARGWAILRELYQAREAPALALDRPPFMIVGHEALVALAGARPHTLEEVQAVPGCSPRVVQRVGGAILEAVARGEALPEAGLPSRQRLPRPHVAAATRRRADALRAWRSKAAHELELDPGVLFPQRLIDRLAAEPPRDLAQLEQVDGVR